MNRKTIRLGLLIMAMGLFASFESSAQSDNNRTQRREPPTTAEIFKEMDANEDGLLSPEEVKGPLKTDFGKIDANEDGFISKEELEKAPKPERGGGRPQGRQ